MRLRCPCCRSGGGSGGRGSGNDDYSLGVPARAGRTGAPTYTGPSSGRAPPTGPTKHRRRLAPKNARAHGQRAVTGRGRRRRRGGCRRSRQASRKKRSVDRLSAIGFFQKCAGFRKKRWADSVSGASFFRIFARRASFLKETGGRYFIYPRFLSPRARPTSAAHVRAPRPRPTSAPLAPYFGAPRAPRPRPSRPTSVPRAPHPLSQAPRAAFPASDSPVHKGARRPAASAAEATAADHQSIQCILTRPLRIADVFANRNRRSNIFRRHDSRPPRHRR